MINGESIHSSKSSFLWKVASSWFRWRGIERRKLILAERRAVIYHETERTSDYVVQIEEWRGEEEGQVTFKRTIRLSDNFAKCLLFANSTKNLEEGKEKAINSIQDTNRGWEPSKWTLRGDTVFCLQLWTLPFFFFWKLSHHFLWLCLRKKNPSSLFVNSLHCLLQVTCCFCKPLYSSTESHQGRGDCSGDNTSNPGVIHMTPSSEPEKWLQLPSEFSTHKRRPRLLRRQGQVLWDLERQKGDS